MLILFSMIYASVHLPVNDGYTSDMVFANTDDFTKTVHIDFRDNAGWPTAASYAIEDQSVQRASRSIQLSLEAGETITVTLVEIASGAASMHAEVTAYRHTNCDSRVPTTIRTITRIRDVTNDLLVVMNPSIPAREWELTADELTGIIFVNTSSTDRCQCTVITDDAVFEFELSTNGRYVGLLDWWFETGTATVRCSQPVDAQGIEFRPTGLRLYQPVPVFTDF